MNTSENNEIKEIYYFENNVYVTKTIVYYDENKKIHREHDLPALIVYSNDVIKGYEWYKHGKKHREYDMPAVIYFDNGLYLEFYKNGLRHRDGDKPAIISPNGSKEYYKNGLRHRDDDNPACIFRHKGILLCWYKNGEKHRYNKPAEISIKGAEYYWENGIFLDDKTKTSYKNRKNRKLYCSIQLYRKRSAKKNTPFFIKWNRNRILEPLLTGIIVSYI